jgi:NAD(P)-dependent dehydrogenase (short-subunit alcohol dehydrogenase family)
VPGGDVFQLLLNGPKRRCRLTRLPFPQLDGDVAPLGHGTRILEQMLGGEIGHRDGVLACQPVICRQDHHSRLAEQRLNRQAMLVGGQPQVSDVDLAVPDDVGLVEPVGPEHLHGQPGVAARELEFTGDFDHFAYTAADHLVTLPLGEYTPESGRAFFELRLVAALDAIRLAVPHIRPGGSVTMTSGTAAFRGGSGWFLGSAASGAIISAARALAVELAPIRVNVVAPGVVRSPLWSELPETDREAMYHGVGRGLPLGRVAEVEDVAKAYLQLMDNDYVTGTVSVVDGGTILV